MRKSGMSVIFIVIWLVMGMIGPAPAETGKVSQVVYITLTKACGCTLVQWFINTITYFLLREDHFPLTLTLSPIGGEGKR